MDSHDYRAELRWDGDPVVGTAAYTAYERQFRVRFDGKPEIVGSAAERFLGDGSRHDPEDLFVAAITSCHMLTYLALCAREGLRVTSYADEARGRLVLRETGGRFEAVALRPRVEIAPGGDVARAIELHVEAHERCFIASSCAVPITCEPTVTLASGPRRARVMGRRDIAVRLRDRPGALAELGELLGRAGVSLEGGGGFRVGEACVVHFLVDDGAAAEAALRAAGCQLEGVREVIAVRLAQAETGQLGKLARAMADAGVNIECVYSDHEHQLILCVDDVEAGKRVAAGWRRAPVEAIAIAATEQDIAYVRAEFATLDELARGRAETVARMQAWAGARMPRASYATPDGTLYYARDWWRMYDEAGGLDAVRAWFEGRYREAGGEDLQADWDAYLAGLYGVCLRVVTPENIVAKERLVGAIDRALAEPRPDDPGWRDRLRDDVAALDALLRPFATCDRERFGRPTSRDRLVDGARRRFRGHVPDAVTASREQR